MFKKDSLMENNEYPKSILPEKNWRKGISGSEILSCCKDAIIGRRIDGKKEEVIDESLGDDVKTLSEIALPTNRIRNLSTNLLGARFGLNEFKFNPRGNGKLNWNEEEEILEPIIIGQDFECLDIENFFVVGWYVNKVEGYMIPYTRTFESKKNYDKFIGQIKPASKDDMDSIYFEEYEKLALVKNGRKIDFTGSLKVNHQPTRLNYWHFTIDLYPAYEFEKPIKDEKSAWQRLMVENVWDYLRRTFLLLDSKMIKKCTLKEWEKMVQRK